MKNYSLTPAIRQIIIACSMSLIISPLWAQSDDVTKNLDAMTEQTTTMQKDDMEGMAHSEMQKDDMEGMDHSEMQKDDMEGMDHSEMQKDDMEGMDHSETQKDDMEEINHSEMNMGGNQPPSDARDPHAYSDGFTLTSGPYAFSEKRVLKLMDEHYFGSFLANRLEYDADNDAVIFDLQGWYGSTYNRFTAKLEGDVVDGKLDESQSDLLWTHAISAFFDTQLGVRFDQYDEGKNRQWLAFGVQGLAPYWFELDMTAYLGESGRSALSVEAEYELLLTQRLILQPRAELTAYGKEDKVNGLGSGLSDVAFGLRLRYELSRQFAPYIGIEWTEKFGETADLARLNGNDDSDTIYVAGIRFWF